MHRDYKAALIIGLAIALLIGLYEAGKWLWDWFSG